MFVPIGSLYLNLLAIQSRGSQLVLCVLSVWLTASQIGSSELDSHCEDLNLGCLDCVSSGQEPQGESIGKNILAHLTWQKGEYSLLLETGQLVSGVPYERMSLPMLL